MLHAGSELEGDFCILRPDGHHKASKYQCFLKHSLIDELASALIAIFQCLVIYAETLRQRLSCNELCSESFGGCLRLFEYFAGCVEQPLDVGIRVMTV